MLPIERTQSQSYYKPEPELKLKLSKTKSCPTRTRRSQSSIRSNGSTGPKLPPNFRSGSIAGITSLSSRDVELNAVESSTSSSVFHGIILVSIMLTSLIAFVCSKIKQACSDESGTECHNKPAILFFSVVTIISCLISFIIYFLHLIGQCDVKWMVKKKFTVEIVFILIIILMLIIANTLMVINTKVLDNWTGILSIICSSIAIIGYAIRIIKLCNECKSFAKNDSDDSKIDETALTVMKERLKHKLNSDSAQSWELRNGVRLSNPPNRGTALRVVSYVKRKRSVDSNPKSPSHNTTVNSFDLEVEDDVFIN